MHRHFGFHEPQYTPRQCFAVWVVLDLISIGLLCATIVVATAILKFAGLL